MRTVIEFLMCLAICMFLILVIAGIMGLLLELVKEFKNLFEVKGDRA